jgi:hypothetical protein
VQKDPKLKSVATLFTQIELGIAQKTAVTVSDSTLKEWQILFLSRLINVLEFDKF